MKREVEILVEVLDSKEKALKVLHAFKFEEEKAVHDIYFYDPKRVDLKPEEGGRLNNSFRLRKKGKKAHITYKKDNFHADGSWNYSDEYETEIQDFEITKKILDNLGIEVLTEVKCTKYIFITDDYEIVLEDVEGLGLFMEVETLKDLDEGDVGEEKDKIRKFMKGLGIKLGKEMDSGKPELMLKKNRYHL